jgi:hypothetical protein
MKFLLILLTIFFVQSNAEKKSESNIELRILDPSKTFVVDNFPAYFICQFTVFGLTFSIQFTRRSHRHIHNWNLFITDEQNRFKSYKSSRIEQLDAPSSNKTSQFTAAHCFLYLQKHLYNRFIGSFDSVSSEILLKQSDLSQVYYATLSFEEKQILDNSTSISRQINIEIDLDDNNSKSGRSPVYKATRSEWNWSDNESRTASNPDSANKSKRAFWWTPKPKMLTIETCVHVHPTVYEEVKASLNTDDIGFITLFLKIFFAERVADVHKIYRNMPSSRLFHFDVVLNDLVVHSTYDDEKPLINKTNQRFDGILLRNQKHDSFLSQANTIVNKRFAHRKNMCDHVFFVHAFPDDQTILGMAVKEQVCRNFYTSLIRWRRLSMETTMAHELGHNLGVDHDAEQDEILQFTVKHPTEAEKKFNCSLDRNRWYMMFSRNSMAKDSYSTSQCTVVQLERSLFENQSI